MSRRSSCLDWPYADSTGFDQILCRVQGEFLEMPGLRLTVAQAQRLWNLDALVCEALLAALVDARFLMRMPDGAFVRADAFASWRARRVG